MFKKDTSKKTADQKPEQGAKKRSALPLVVSLDYPFTRGDTTVREITCERRPTVRTMKRLAACGEDDAEMIEIMFEELFDMAPSESDMVDMEDGLRALELVTDFFPKLKGEEKETGKN
jgi:hypothetical protein